MSAQQDYADTMENVNLNPKDTIQGNSTADTENNPPRRTRGKGKKNQQDEMNDKVESQSKQGGEEDNGGEKNKSNEKEKDNGIKDGGEDQESRDTEGNETHVRTDDQVSNRRGILSGRG
ncbi:uncharacterized protein MELLADRAFT_65012 [Melampsora larici-populina 98AG31]|uniref:Uncharacterized protein n=1 Tax=Melampsora larici-populina (strain 98AG31 / pathotype 3-4-7) TaxID=747676 RepID=F4RTN2_MELLP|nr:uncharacterized protein MELLADRAFT_65012 [Melampsora larici-populina 98AG31]EGG04287.1 hypothetical protein MELLADRAFT_65012 [Melampsora larici-populina 98AG31]